jgi:ABC-type molybdenum transport system ATPase subunit/photorepair protein PhrA
VFNTVQQAGGALGLATLTALAASREEENMPGQGSAIAVSCLRKAYRSKTVLNGADLEVAEGSIFAWLGPNGAGKTTMF